MNDEVEPKRPGLTSVYGNMLNQHLPKFKKHKTKKVSGWMKLKGSKNGSNY